MGQDVQDIYPPKGLALSLSVVVMVSNRLSHSSCNHEDMKSPFSLLFFCSNSGSDIALPHFLFWRQQFDFPARNNTESEPSLSLHTTEPIRFCKLKKRNKKMPTTSLLRSYPSSDPGSHAFFFFCQNNRQAGSLVEASPHIQSLKKGCFQGYSDCKKQGERGGEENYWTVQIRFDLQGKFLYFCQCPNDHQAFTKQDRRLSH